jgi:hypothetical protein
MDLSEDNIFVDHVETRPGEINSTKYHRLNILFDETKYTKDEVVKFSELIHQLVKLNVIS